MADPLISTNLSEEPGICMRAAGHRIPLTVKLALTAFVAVQVPAYWRAYGPANFLFLCDVALFLTLAAVWLENSLLASMSAVGVLVPQTLWSIDFLSGFTGTHLFNITPYMFDPDLSLHLRILSAYHLWLPMLLAWLVWRLGYDRRGFAAWCLLALIVLVVSYATLPPPPPQVGQSGRTVNVNFVYGFSPRQPQQWMHPDLYFILVMLAAPLIVFGPAHLLLRWGMPKARE